MAGLLQELADRAASLMAALTVYDGEDGVVFANERHRDLYPFVDFSKRIDYHGIAMECVKHRKLDESSIYKAPERWIAIHARFRLLNRSSRTLTRHTDGRIVQVTYERLEGTNGGWYQMRRDVTADVLRCIRDGLDPLWHINSDDPSSPAQTTFMVRLLDRISQPAALLTTRGQVIDGNLAFARILSRADGLVLARGRLGLSASPDAQQAFLRSAAGFYRRRKRAPVTVCAAKVDRQSFYLLTLSEPQTEHLGWEATATDILLLSITDPKTVPDIEPRIVADLLQITEPEARVAQAWASGQTAEEIASEHDVSREAIGIQMASILKKTGFRDFAAVARQVTTLSYVFGSRI